MLHGKQGFVTRNTRCHVHDGSGIKRLACEQASDWFIGRGKKTGGAELAMSGMPLGKKKWHARRETVH